MKSKTVKKSVVEIVLYLIFGFLTTVISLVTYWVLTRIIYLDYYVSNILSWIIAVTFAFFTNRGIVFRDFGNVWKKATLFFLSRISTLVLETTLLVYSIELLGINDFFTKIVVQVIVIISNYLLGKFIVFRKRKINGIDD